MKTSIIKLFRGSTGEVRFNKKAITFIVCLVVSSFFWLTAVFSKLYTTTINVPVSYVDFPSDKIAFDQLPSTIGIEIRASGFRILWFKLLNRQNKPIVLNTRDIRPYKKGYYLTTVSKIEEVSKQLSSEFRIMKITPDTLFMGYDNKVEKIVPVKLNMLIDYEKQHYLKDSIRISPSAIQISGPEDIIDKINFVETESVVVKKASEQIVKKVAIHLPSARVKSSFTAVNITIPVTHFTEGSIELPVIIENLPHAYSIKTFPDKVAIKYKVAYEDYGKINANMFKVFVDYSKIKDNNRLRVEVKQFPSQFVSEKSIRIIPEKVEYIIRK